MLPFPPFSRVNWTYTEMSPSILTQRVTHPLVQVADANGVTQSYTYGSGPEAGLLRSIQVPGGNLVTFTYLPGTVTSLLSSIEDWSGRFWTFQYDSSSFLTTFTTPLGCQTKYTYSLAGSGTTLLYSIQDPRGFVTTYMYDSAQRVVSMAAGSAVWTWTYDNANQRSVMTEPSGALTTYNYGVKRR